MRTILVCLILAGCGGPGAELTDMSQSLELRPTGLYTDPSPHGGAPPGALRVADNVVLRRDGILQPRPGFEDGKSGGLTAATTAKALIPYDGDMLVIGSSGDDATEWMDSGSGVTADGSTALSWDTGRDHATAVQARGNLYLATQDAVRKLESASDLTASKVGAPAPTYISGFAEVTPGSIMDQYGGRAYRATIQRTDGNGVVVTSAPSPASIYQSDGATSLDLTATIVLGQGTVEGDTIQLWRTPQVVGSVSALGVPGEEYFLVSEQSVTASDVTNGLATVADSVSEKEVGSSLYTNPSREGILQSNDRPHTAKDVALFRGSMFYANTRGPHRLRVAAPVVENQTGNASGVGSRSITGDTLTGTNTILNASSTTGLLIGQVIIDSDFPVGTRITAIAGTTITVNNNATGTTVTGALSIDDSVRIKVGSLEDQYYSVADAGIWDLIRGISGGDSSTTGSAYVRAFTTLRSVLGDGSPPSRKEFVLEEIDRAGNSFQVWATHGDEYEPALPEPTEATGTASSADIRPNGIQWSKSDQPEHVPEGNFTTVGGEAEILRLIPTKDALFIFKKDGIWRLTGFGATAGWRVDPIDRSTYLLNPRCATVMSGSVYAWTNRGVVRVSDFGVADGDILSKLSIGSDLRSIELALSQYSVDTGGAWVAANEKDDELLVGVPAAAGNTISANVYVFNTKTRSWVRWPLPYSHAVVRPDDGLLWVGQPAIDSVQKERRGSTVPHSDREYSVTITDVTGTQVTVSSSSWSPSVGDMVQVGSNLARVVSVTSSTVVSVDMTGLSTGAATAYESFESVIEFVAETGGNPAARKNFQELTVIWEDLIQVREFSVGYTSSAGATEVSETRTMTRSLASTQPRAEYFLVPTEHAMVSQIWPKITIQQAGSAWEMAGIGLTYDVMSPLVEFSGEPSNLVAQ